MPDPRRQKAKRELNWALRAVFDLMEEKKLTFEGFEGVIFLKSNIRIPASTLKYWYYGHSEPKISEFEIMAEALGYEMDIMLKDADTN